MLDQGYRILADRLSLAGRRLSAAQREKRKASFFTVPTDHDATQASCPKEQSTFRRWTDGPDGVMIMNQELKEGNLIPFPSERNDTFFLLAALYPTRSRPASTPLLLHTAAPHLCFLPLPLPLPSSPAVLLPSSGVRWVEVGSTVHDSLHLDEGRIVTVLSMRVGFGSLGPSISASRLLCGFSFHLFHLLHSFHSRTSFPTFSMSHFPFPMFHCSVP